MDIRASYYQQFDADYTLDIPEEGFGGWAQDTIALDLTHSAELVQHKDTKSRRHNGKMMSDHSIPPQIEFATMQYFFDRGRRWVICPKGCTMEHRSFGVLSPKYVPVYQYGVLGTDTETLAGAESFTCAKFGVSVSVPKTQLNGGLHGKRSHRYHDTFAGGRYLSDEYPRWLWDKLEWFQDLKFGLFIHWGIYSQWGCIESWPLVEEDTWAQAGRIGVLGRAWARPGALPARLLGVEPHFQSATFRSPGVGGSRATGRHALCCLHHETP